jgi:hypothetical protein
MVKRHFWVIPILAITLSAVIPVGAANAQTFKSCKKVNLLHPNGVALDKKTAGASKAHVSRKIYLANRRLDSNKDGIVCERDSTPTPKPADPRWMRAYPRVRDNGVLSETKSPVSFRVIQSPTLSDRPVDVVNYFARRIMSYFSGRISSSEAVLVLIHDGHTTALRSISEPSRAWLQGELMTFGCRTDYLEMALSNYAGWVTTCGLNNDGTPKQAVVLDSGCATGAGHVALNIPPGCLTHELGHVIHNFMTPPGTNRPYWFNESFATSVWHRLSDNYPEWGGEIRSISLMQMRQWINRWMDLRRSDPRQLTKSEISQFLSEFSISPLPVSITSQITPNQYFGVLIIETLIAEFGEDFLYSWMRQWTTTENWQNSFERIFQTSFVRWINDSLVPALADDLLGDCGARYTKSRKSTTCPTD